MPPKTAVILQARLDSARLPGKSLLPLAGKPLVRRVMEALRRVNAAVYVLACPEDCARPFAPLAAACGFRLVTGSKEDVLERYCDAIRAIGFNAGNARVIRATGDNPFVFADAARAINEEAAACNADYAAYTGLPYGAGVESVAARALLRAGDCATGADEREHVCPYLYGHPEIFTLYRPPAPPQWHKPALRLTIDTQDDYEQMRALAERSEHLWENGMNGADVIAAASVDAAASLDAAATAAAAPEAGGRRRSLRTALCIAAALRALSAPPDAGAELPPGTDAAPVMALPEPAHQETAKTPEAPEGAAVSIERPLRARPSILPARLEAYRKERQAFPPEAEAEAPGNSLPGLEHPLTQRYIQRYSERGLRKWLAGTLKSGEPYLAFIRAEIERRGLPPYLLYLPVIESGFMPAALSRSGASGIWQFMRNSIRPYLRITEWLDERRDFYKSTSAALSKLEAHYREFGDWYLALAAYNSGGGTIAAAIRQTGIHDYWELNVRNKLKKETSVYVPKLLAVYYIASNPRRFGLDLDWSNEVYEWELVPVPRQIDITLLAEEAGLERDALRAFNRELLYNVTPPRQPDGNEYALKVRKEYAAAVRAVLEQDGLPLIRSYIHIIREGDTLSALSLYYGVSVDTIIASNPGTRPAALQLGRRLLIPAVKDVSGPPPPKPAAPPRPPANQTRPASGASAATAAAAAGIKIWRVEKGDTLYGIARKAGVTVDALAAKNGMSARDTLSIGRILELP